MIPNHFLSDRNFESILLSNTKEKKEVKKQNYDAGTTIEDKPAFYKIEDQSPVYSESAEIPKYILDPFSVIVKLAILSKKDIACKLCIMNNVLYIQEPGLFQPLVRYLFQNTKEELSYLYNPIEIACSHFIHKNTP